MIEIHRWTASDLQNGADALARILHGCVHDGASVGFILPHPFSEAVEFWRGAIIEQVRQGQRLLLVALENGVAVGTVSLVTASPANQPHRAEISKLLVHPDHRRKGIARRLMQAAEQAALSAGKTLLTLDTRSGDSAEPLYASIGFETAGVIPGYCLDVTGQRFDSTTYMYKPLAPVPA